MAEGLNKAMLLGNLGADPELRMTPNGQAVLKLRLATSEKYMDRNRQRQERTEWHSIVIWGKRAEALSRILAKGSRIFVEGGIRTSSYDDRDGNKRYRTEIVATDIKLQGGNGNGAPRDTSLAGEMAREGALPLDDAEPVPTQEQATTFNDEPAPDSSDIPF